MIGNINWIIVPLGILCELLLIGVLSSPKNIEFLMVSGLSCYWKVEPRRIVVPLLAGKSLFGRKIV